MCLKDFSAVQILWMSHTGFYKIRLLHIRPLSRFQSKRLAGKSTVYSLYAFMGFRLDRKSVV